jgi:hypothetical protein
MERSVQIERSMAAAAAGVRGVEVPHRVRGTVLENTANPGLTGSIDDRGWRTFMLDFSDDALQPY